MPLVSIIIPVYNSENYLKRSIECCICQTIIDIEIIFIDDKGQDDSVKIIQKYMQKDNRIKLVDNIINQGIFRAKRVGALNASGKYLMFLDPDDELELNACEILYNEMEKYNVDFLYFNGEVFDNGKREQILKFIDETKIYTISEFRDFFITNKGKWVLWLKIYKRDMYLKALECIDGVDCKLQTNITEDVLVFYHILSLAKNVKMLNKCFYKYYLQNTSVTKNLSKVGFEKSMGDYQKIALVIQKSSQKYGFNSEFMKKYLARLKKDEYSFIIRYYKQDGYLKNIFKIVYYRLLKISINIGNFLVIV